MFAGAGEAALGQGVTPPDPQVAAGPDRVVEQVNDAMLVFDKAGTLLATYSLDAFFASTSPAGFRFDGDPKIVYDRGSGRFFASGMLVDGGGSGPDGGVVLAVSATSDPEGLWGTYVVTTSTGVFDDQPKLGVTADKVVLSWADFVGANFTGQETWVIEKADVLSGVDARNSIFPSDPSRPEIVLAQDPAGITAYAAYNSSTGSAFVGVMTISGTPAQFNVVMNEVDVPLAATSAPMLAQQPGGVTFDTGDDRLQSAAWQNNQLWLTSDTSCVPSGDIVARACMRIIQVDTSNPGAFTLAMSFDIGQAGFSLAYPAIALDPGGTAACVFTASSPTEFPSVATTTIAANTGTPTPFLTLQGGAGTYTDTLTPHRWGDYSGVAADPVNPSDIWLVGEDKTTPGAGVEWGTAIGRVTLAQPTISAVVPTTGPPSQSSMITVQGTDFVASATTVSFGSAAASGVTVQSPESLTAVSPALGASTVDITVTTADGTSALSPQDRFTFGAPSPTPSPSPSPTPAPPPPPPPPIPPGGYWLVASDGGIFPFGAATGRGSTGAIRLNQPIVGMAATPDGGGYWLVASDGGIFPFGDAAGHGSTGGTHLNRPIVGMAATPDGGGYWLVASDGGIFPFGDAAGLGSTGGLRLNRPIVGMAATHDGGGYWLVASDGGVFPFGDASGHGSTGGIRLNQPIVGMAATPGSGGYWLVASDGGIFPFGDAAGHGSTGGTRLNQPIVGMAATPDGGGYWLVASDGGIFPFGDAGGHGSTGGIRLNRPVVGMAAAI